MGILCGSSPPSGPADIPVVNFYLNSAVVIVQISQFGSQALGIGHDIRALIGTRIIGNKTTWEEAIIGGRMTRHHPVVMMTPDHPG